METRSVPERYAALCLRVGAHDEDFVDAYIGPADLREEAPAGAPHDPRILRDEAPALLDEVPDELPEGDRRRWLLARLRAIECVTARLIGDDIAWADEVERCSGLPPEPVDEDLFYASHARLDAVLPGTGDLSSRFNAWLDSAMVPPRWSRVCSCSGGPTRRGPSRRRTLPPLDVHVEIETDPVEEGSGR